MILRDARGWTDAENLLSSLQNMSQGTLEKQIMKAHTTQLSFAAIAEKKAKCFSFFQKFVSVCNMWGSNALSRYDTLVEL